MSKCPNCNSEVPEGKTQCPVCNASLEDNPIETVLIPSVQFADEDEASRFIDFLNYSGITDTSYEADSNGLIFNIRGNEKDIKQIYNLFIGFRLGEEEVQEENQEEEIDDSPKLYVKKREKYNDISTTGTMLIVIGILGLIYVTLNLFHILKLLTGIVPICLNIFIFVIALVYGILSLFNARKLKEAADSEDHLAIEIRQWLRENMTKEFIASIPVEAGLPDELDYMERTNAIQKQILDKFQTDDAGLVESLVEEYYQFVTEKKLYEM